MDIIVKITKNENTPYVCKIQKGNETVFLKRRLTPEQKAEIASKYWKGENIDIKDKISKHIGPCSTCFDTLEQLRGELKLQYGWARVILATLNDKPFNLAL